LDLDLPISELLKVGTQRAHADAEHSEGAKELMRGTLGLEEYVRWNVILWRVYE
jgi:heme oxygenase